ncbi:DNA polymerase III subunits gamma and tau [Pseudoalteromonas sp. P1-9]|uniref:vWA domain-containing protein n=1 Tax=Pseudoalteromonas sp. P1-9 TaxID=1710354 RepID=UPI0006D62EFA|nr:VWA domain-containing protein [Pseudoalteromonas sp. P1-9]KPV97300.1 DNA polymerase III subunits gamma and tau [Pseudoalteromonas sp. P1-9]
MTLEFIRPEAFYLLPLVALVMALQFIKKRKHISNSPIAPHLAQFLLDGETKHSKTNSLWLSLFLFVSVVALAGPSWQSQPLPVYQSKHARVLVMDMSRSMYSQDIKPNRLTQARFKALTLTDILKESDLALVAYSNDAYTISPLTSDHQTLANLIPSLSPEIMPVPGSNTFAGINLAVELLNQASVTNGEIYWITDGIDDFDESRDIEKLLNKHNIKLNIYAVATEQGAPIQLPNEGFLKDNYGQIVIPKANFSLLQQLASNTGGKFNYYQVSDADLALFKPTSTNQEDVIKREQTSQQPIDGGIYLVFLLIPLGFMMLKHQPKFLLGLCYLFIFKPSVSYALSLPSWLLNDEQKAHKAYQQQDYKAASNAKTANLSGSALYQQGDFENALKKFKQDSSAEGLYNQGNALAKLNRFDEAIDAYDKALAQQPEFKQAQENKALLEDLKQQQQNQQSQDGKNQEQDKQQQGDNQQQQDQQSGQQNQQSNEQNQQNGKQSESQDQQNQNGEKSEGEKQGNNNQPDMKAESSPEQQDQKEQHANPSDKEPEQQPEGEAEQQSEQQQQAEQQMPQQQATPAPELTPEEKEQVQIINQLLRKVPDDPAILLRNKMKLESQKRYRQRIQQQGVEKSW